MSIVLTNTRILFAGYDLSAQFNRIALDHTVEALDETTFGMTSKKMRGGLKSSRASGSGFWRAAAGDVDPALFDSLALDDAVLALFPEDITEGATSTGSGYMFKVTESRYTPLSGKAGELIGFSLECAGRGV